MSDPSGPKVEIPDDLADELESSESESRASREETAPARGTAASGDAESPASSPDAEGRDPEAELAALNDKYLRLAAEFDNFRRRALKERQDLLNYAAENLIKELLVTVDNLERALGHSRQEQEEGSNGENLSEGVELTYRSLLQALEKAGLQAVEAEGRTFDPQVHEALRQVPTDDCEPGRVLEVYQKGYLLRDRLLRPALVAVAGPAEKRTDE